MNFKKIFQKVFYPTLKRYYIIFLSWSIQTKFFFYPTLKKYNFFSCEDRVYILKSFKSYIEKITFEHRVYILKGFKSFKSHIWKYIILSF